MKQVILILLVPVFVFSAQLETVKYADSRTDQTQIAAYLYQSGNPYLQTERISGSCKDLDTPVDEKECQLNTGISQYFLISINNQVCVTEQEDYGIESGLPNRLTIKAKPDNSLIKKINVELKRILPDGRQDTKSAQMTPAKTEALLDLGLFAVPAVFEYEAGVVYRHGIRFHLCFRDAESHEIVEEFRFYQTINEKNDREVLSFGDKERVVHLGWKQFNQNQPMDPPILLRLSNAVLSHPDSVKVLYQVNEDLMQNDEKSLTSIPALLKVIRQVDDTILFEKPIHVRDIMQEKVLNVSAWPEGSYRIEIIPHVKGSSDHFGPVILYKRKKLETEQVFLSPFSPLAFERDQNRPEKIISDFRVAISQGILQIPQNTHWQCAEKSGNVCLVNTSGDYNELPVLLQPELKGWYAIYALAENGYCYIRVGKKGIPRGLGKGLCYVAAIDMNHEVLAIYASVVPGSGLRELRFIPVTEKSVRSTLEQAANPPKPLIGIVDWGDYFCPPPFKHSAGGRLSNDQYDAILKGHAELGIQTIDWAIGRSWVYYNSKLPETTRFPCVPLDSLTSEKDRRTYGGQVYMLDHWDPLEYVLKHRSKYNINIVPWLAMNRHYGANSHGGIFASKWFISHPEWRCWRKKVHEPVQGEVSYFFPGVRKERVNILAEVAEKNPDGLVIGACRQAPMLLYNPVMVKAYMDLTGIDPTKINASQSAQYEQWIRWRSNFFTKTLRELRDSLDTICSKIEKSIPVSVRVPSKGFFVNLAQGLDVETWCREKLVQRIQLDPIEDCVGYGSHDVRPYVDYCHRHGVEVYGGINFNTLWNYTVFYKRALSLLKAGVDGIELYESNNQIILKQERWIVPLLGNAGLLQSFLQSSNMESCYPVWSRNAITGHDNHSFDKKWCVFSMDKNSL